MTRRHYDTFRMEWKEIEEEVMMGNTKPGAEGDIAIIDGQELRVIVAPPRDPSKPFVPPGREGGKPQFDGPCAVKI